MTTPRREFMKNLLALGAAVPAFSPALEAMGRVVQQAAPQGFEPDPGAIDFWNRFLHSESVPTTAAPGAPGGAMRGAPAGLEREAFFFHYGTDGFQAAMDIPATALQPEGDVTVALNVAGFRPAEEDRNTFERLQSAQLRLDFLQNVPIVDLLDTMAWTAVAVLHPKADKKLPPIQDLSFDPGTTWQKMQNIVLPKGQGRWAVNLYAQKRDGFFSQFVQVVTKEVGRFAPVLGLPGISMIALQSFNAFYGAFHTRPEYLFQSNPVPIFGTQMALESAASTRGVPLRTGTYVLVPLAHVDELTPDRLKAFELKQGLIVPKNTSSINLYNAAAEVLPNVTYATLEVVVKSAQIPCGGKTAK